MPISLKQCLFERDILIECHDEYYANFQDYGVRRKDRQRPPDLIRLDFFAKYFRMCLPLNTDRWHPNYGNRMTFIPPAVEAVAPPMNITPAMITIVCLVI